MTRTEAIRKIVQSKITSLRYTAYADEAPDGAVYPYVVYNINSFSFLDARDDIVLDIDIWDSYPNYSRVEEMADNIEAEFTGDAVYSSTSIVLPQFFRYIRTKVPDTDKKIKRINLKVDIQNYMHPVTEVVTSTVTTATVTSTETEETQEENNE